jgi:hypothetical protein
MLPSFHDDYLVGYDVDCEARRIRLHIKSSLEQATPSTVVFTGVDGYCFENDAFGNIIFDLEPVSLEWFVSKYRDELAEMSRYGALGQWASDLDSAPGLLSERGVQAFILSASIGLTGWILAKEVSVSSDRTR